MDLLTIIFIGRSGCGKGTQVEKLTEYLKEKGDERESFHMEAGDRFRNFIKESSYASGLAKEINESGELQPEFLSIWAWGGEITRKLDEDQHLFVDGTPRRLIEARVLESAFEFFNRSKVQIVYINVSRNWSVERMQERGRVDDISASNIETRMRWFEQDVAPVLEYYRSHKSHIFHEINGEQTVEKVHQDIVDSLGL